jgi:hypothetical protein
MRTILSTTAIAALVVAGSIQTSEARSSHHSTHYVSHTYSRSASHVRYGTRRYARLGRSHAAPVARGGAGCGSLTAVHAHSGATACVSSSAASNFQEFVSALESTGYRIDFMGGWRAHGSCGRCNMHPRGLAIDINQTGRSRVTRGFPSGVTALAARYGLLHGAVWSHPDVGHFELASASPTFHGVYASADRVRRRGGRHAVASMTGISMETPAVGGDRMGGGF